MSTLDGCTASDLFDPDAYSLPFLLHSQNFNYHLCRARRLVENVFGILIKKWRVFFRLVEIKVETTVSVVKACCVLHNFLFFDKNVDENFELSTEIEQRPLQGMNNLPVDGRRGTNYAYNLREKFVNYFSSIPWSYHLQIF